MRVLAIGAHPDDIELGMAGTLLLLGKAGCELHVMTAANGSCGTAIYSAEEAASVRGAESRAAAEVLGAEYHAPIANDLGLYYDAVCLGKMTSAIRTVAPDILLLPSPFDYMEDHTMTCRLGVMGAFCRGMPNLPLVEPPRPAIEGDIVVYHAQPHGHHDSLGQFQKPDFMVDISSVMDVKTSALACHKSQQDWLDQTQAMNQYLQTMHDLCHEIAVFGTKKDCQFAEGWRRHNYMGFCKPNSDPLCDLLKPFINPMA